MWSRPAGGSRRTGGENRRRRRRNTRRHHNHARWCRMLKRLQLRASSPSASLPAPTLPEREGLYPRPSISPAYSNAYARSGRVHRGSRLSVVALPGAGRPDETRVWAKRIAVRSAGLKPRHALAPMPAADGHDLHNRDYALSVARTVPLPLLRGLAASLGRPPYRTRA